MENIDMNKIIEIVKSENKLPSTKLTPRILGIASEKQTFFYGYPRFIDGDIPTDSKGKQLRFMAQINCADLINMPDFPKEGLLQFWAQADHYYMFLNIKDPRAYQVIYIENPVNNNIDNVSLDESLYKNGCADFPYIESNDLSMNLVMSHSFDESYPNDSDIDVLITAVKNICDKLGYDCPSHTDIIDTEAFKTPFGDRVGGYPSFTQYPPKERLNNWDTLLLQLDSNKFVTWGDNGVAGFYISHEDLINKNFSNIGFYWDCY